MQTILDNERVNMSAPKISVVLPTYNGAATLADAVRSILNQTFQDMELIVVDDASSQDINAVLEEFKGDEKLRYIRNDSNIGLAASINAGVAAAKGRYIARMDDDDFSVSIRLETQLEFLDAHTDVDVVGGGIALYDRDLNYIRDHMFPSEHEEIVRFLCRGNNPLAHPSVMFRREFFDRAGGYNASLRRVEDLELWGRMALTCRYANIPQVLLRHRIRHAKTLKVVRFGVKYRLRNGLLLGCFPTALFWTSLYVVIEVLRHMGYRQRAFRPLQTEDGQSIGFSD